MNKLTKIVATLGPASDSETTIKKLIKNGVNVFRFNTKHGTPQWHEQRIKLVQQIATKLNNPVGILIDLQGPEIRIQTKNSKPINIKKDKDIILSSTFDSSETQLVIPYERVIEELERSDQLFIDDGNIVLTVYSRNGNIVKLRSSIDLTLDNHKGANFPGKHIDAPSLIEADLRQLDMASLNTVDYIALSFARNVEDIDALRKEMQKRKVEAKIIVKVENQEAIDNIDALVEAGDGIMVARGDLGVEVPIEKLAYLQKMIIDKAKMAHKPVITATEMLHSMIGKPRPTRAEATDVSNAVFFGTDAVMLSGETASGQYPVEAVQMMNRIAQFTESVKTFQVNRKTVDDQTQLIAMAAMEMILNEGIKVDKIVAFTQTGYTARVISSFRPNVPIIAVTNNQKTVESLALSYGVFGFHTTFPPGNLISPSNIINRLALKKFINKGETILVIHGARWKEPGLTNSITLATY